MSYLLDIDGVDEESFHQADTIRNLLVKASLTGGLEILDQRSHQFSWNQRDPRRTGGCTAFLLLTESHISAHTWPEFGKIVIDLFSCGSREQADRALDFLLKQIPHSEFHLSITERGH